MRTRLAVVAGMLVLAAALAGCTAEAKTDDESCGSITDVWDKFEAVAQNPGRDDAEMLDRRDAVIDAWTAAAADSPEWTRNAITPTLDALRDFAVETGSVGDQTARYQTVVSGVEKIRSQCVADGNL